MQYLVLGFAPGVYWLWYFYRRDELEPEPKKLIIRAVLSVPAHALFSSVWGYALARYKFAGKKKIGIIFAALLIAMILHAAFNFLAIIQVFSTFGLLILVAVMWLVINNKIDKAEKDSPYATRSFLNWKKQKLTRREE
jgi:RsiW-degrading membrane proteinase PrsW (M82 family)